jgi:hypothetical protein
MIYPVRIKYYFTTDYMPEDELKIELAMIKGKLPSLKCNICGGPVTMEKGYISHAFSYGFDDTNYCSKKCFKRIKNDD